MVIKHNGIYPKSKDEFKKTSSLAQYPGVKIHLQFFKETRKPGFQMSVCLGPHRAPIMSSQVCRLKLGKSGKSISCGKNFQGSSCNSQVLHFCISCVSLLHLLSYTSATLVLNSSFPCATLLLPGASNGHK